MTPQKQIELTKKLDSELLQILESKGHDYGQDVDVLSNFKQVSGVAALLNIDIKSPTQYSLFMVILKIARITNLLNSKKKAKNEPVKDSLKDGINYFKLTLLNYIEEYEGETE